MSHMVSYRPLFAMKYNYDTWSLNVIWCMNVDGETMSDACPIVQNFGVHLQIWIHMNFDGQPRAKEPNLVT